ncbi:hypothetical protein OIV83_005612 [Microbotryomycetes sp. JL201]|nr:hypothetical protein OIV83_005612 [Microbotryomycetes sp. JL201]
MTQHRNYAQLRPPRRASRSELLRFHEAHFIDAMIGLDPETSELQPDSDESAASSDSEPTLDKFRLMASSTRPRKRRRRSADPMGLEDDCPMFDELSEYVQLVAGASIEAADLLRKEEADIVINWHGGRHHARRGQASGFCYVQDIVLAILKLRDPLPGTSRAGTVKVEETGSVSESGRDERDNDSSSKTTHLRRITKVMYIDLDLHHGDGVEEAFLSTASVLTLSVHNHAPGFFPSTGSLFARERQQKARPADHHALSVPLKPGASSATLLRVLDSCIEPVYRAYKPNAVVLQCGCDGLAGDPCQEWNVDLEGFGQIVQRILSWGAKTLMLGGGGYNHVNVAKCWTYLTSIALGRPLNLEDSIPSSLDEHDYHAFVRQSPTLDVVASQKSDQNTDEFLGMIEKAFAESIEALQQRYT